MKPVESTGRAAACEKLKALFDAGTFAEFGELVTRPNSEVQEGIICGCGAVDGRLVYAFYEDVSSLKGAVDTAHIRKINNLFSLAEKNGAPVVSFLNSAGATVLEGSDLLAAYGELFANAARLSGTVLQIAVINGVCTGSQALFASLADFTISTGKTAKFSFSPASVLKSAGNKNTSANTTIVCEDEGSAVAMVKKLISILPSNFEEEVETNPDDVNRDISLTFGTEPAAILNSLSDFGNAIELYASECSCVRTFIASINGKACGFICANGEIGATGFNRASALVSFCDSFNIPVITIADTSGFSAVNEAAGKNILKASAKFVAAIANASITKIALITGKAYGAGYTVFASKAIYDVVYALDGAEISIMSPESAVEFINNADIAASLTPDTTRVELIQAWKSNEASPALCAQKGYIDAVIKPEDLLKYTAFALEMMSSKRCTSSPKKHYSK